MPAKTRYLAKKVLDHVLGKTTYTRPTTVYLALLTAVPDASGSLTAEVSGGGYARQALTAVMQATDATSGRSVNTSAVTFPTPAAAYGTVLGFYVMDALTGGNALYYGPLTTPQTITAGGAPFIAAAGSVEIVEI